MLKTGILGFSRTVSKKLITNASSGDIAIIFGRAKNNVIGVGLYDSMSPICIKMIHHGGGVLLDSNFFFNKINEAYAITHSLY